MLKICKVKEINVIFPIRRALRCLKRRKKPPSELSDMAKFPSIIAKIDRSIDWFHETDFKFVLCIFIIWMWTYFHSVWLSCRRVQKRKSLKKMCQFKTWLWPCRQIFSKSSMSLGTQLNHSLIYYNFLLF